MSNQILDINLVFICVTILVALVIALVARRWDKVTEAADKARTEPQVITALEEKYNQSDPMTQKLFDLLNTVVSLLHRSVPVESPVYKPIEAVDALVDEVMDGTPATSKPAPTVTVTMPAEAGTSVNVTQADAQKSL